MHAAALAVEVGRAAFRTPVLLGGPKFQTMGPLVFSTFAQQNNWPVASADRSTTC